MNAYPAKFLATGFLILATCQARDKSSTGSDDFAHLSSRNMKVLPLERLADIHLNKSTLTNIQQIFGDQESDRRTYRKMPLPKVYRGKTYDVFRLTSYTSFTIEEKVQGNVVETSWKESKNITFFFNKKDILLFYTVRHQHHDGNGNTWAGRLHDFEKDSEELWPGSVCDAIFHDIYETQRVQGSKYFGPVTTQKCTWLDKLKADVANGVVK